MDADRRTRTEADVPRAIAGEQAVVIPGGQTAADRRVADGAEARREAMDRLLAGLKDMAPLSKSSVELLREMYEEDEPVWPFT